MANPPFNLDMVDASRVSGDCRLPFGLPGTTKSNLDRGKPEERRDWMLMIDARNIYRKVTRKINDFSPEQLKLAVDFHRPILELHERFPDPAFVAVPGLYKAVTRAENTGPDCTPDTRSSCRRRATRGG